MYCFVNIGYSIRLCDQVSEVDINPTLSESTKLKLGHIAFLCPMITQRIIEYNETI